MSRRAWERLSEAAKLGFARAALPKACVKRLPDAPPLELSSVDNLERALEALGSDFDYYIWGGGIMKAIRLMEKGNLIFRASGGYGKDLPFHAAKRVSLRRMGAT